MKRMRIYTRGGALNFHNWIKRWNFTWKYPCVWILQPHGNLYKGVSLCFWKISYQKTWKTRGEVSVRNSSDQTIYVTNVIGIHLVKFLKFVFWFLSFRYLSNAEIVRLVQPKTTAISKVRSWALEVCPHAVLESSQFGDFLKLTANVGCLEQLLSQNLYHYTHPKSQRTIIGGTQTFEIPERLNPFVRHVFGLVEFFPIIKSRSFFAYFR